jgi:hypothetical protein
MNLRATREASALRRFTRWLQTCPLNGAEHVRMHGLSSEPRIVRALADLFGVWLLSQGCTYDASRRTVQRVLVQYGCPRTAGRPQGALSVCADAR